MGPRAGEGVASSALEILSENALISSLLSVRASAAYHQKAGPRTALPFPPWRFPGGPVAAF
jgi:hypothetical protein